MSYGSERDWSSDISRAVSDERYERERADSDIKSDIREVERENERLKDRIDTLESTVEDTNERLGKMMGLIESLQNQASAKSPT